MSLDAQEAELLCLICQDGMSCISFVPDAWNLSGRCQVTQDAQDAGDATQDAQGAGDAEDATQDAQDAGDATQDAQDAGDADSTSRASGRNGAVPDAGYFFADGVSRKVTTTIRENSPIQDS